MLGVVRRAAHPSRARAAEEAMLGGEAVSRRLAAIVAADVVGCLPLMEADEEGMFARLKSLRHDLIDPKIALRKGRTVRAAGDRVLVEFANAVEAVPIAAG